MDLAKASKNVQSLIRVLETKRQDSEQHFEDIFRSAETMAEKLDFEIRKPRNFGRRGDYTVTDCKTYYRVAVYIPLLETIVSDLKDRFSKEVLDSFKLAMLLPQPAIALSLEEAKDVVAALAKHLALSLAVAIIDRPCCFLSLKANFACGNSSGKMNPNPTTPNNFQALHKKYLNLAIKMFSRQFISS